MFEEYHDSYKKLVSSVTSHLATLDGGSQDKEAATAIVQEVPNLLSEAADTLKQMELEARTAEATKRSEYMQTVADAKKSLANLRNEFERSKERATRSHLLGDKSIQQREKMMDTTEKYV